MLIQNVINYTTPGISDRFNMKEQLDCHWILWTWKTFTNEQM